MDYQELKQYISEGMKMQHIYQPVMIKTLLESKGYRAPVEPIPVDHSIPGVTGVYS